MKKNSYTSLSTKYREKEISSLSSQEVEAYLIARFPATYAVCCKVLEEVQKRISLSVSSFLDLGAGPGTGFLAAKEIFEDLKEATLVENNPLMFAKRFETGQANWVMKDLYHFTPTFHNLALFSYSFGEIHEKMQLEILEEIWQKVDILVIIEPGTPRGFSRILKARKRLIELGGHMIAPCPHAGNCPLANEDWCHFSTRIERSREHRHLKEGTLGWEDEKFSYIAMGKQEARVAKDRILRHPQKHTGHIILQLCKEGEKTVSKKDREFYKKTRKSKWGEELEE